MTSPAQELKMCLKSAQKREAARPFSIKVNF